MTTNLRTVLALRRRGYLAGSVEGYFAGRRRDLFGLVDLIAVGRDGVLFVQATDADHASEHHAKLRGDPKLQDVARRILEAGFQPQMWAWGKRGPLGPSRLWWARIFVAGRHTRGGPIGWIPDGRMER